MYTGLVGDIGGTHARLALVDEEGHIRHPVTYDERNFPSLTEVIASYLEKTMGRKRPERAVLAVAGPVVDGEIEFTNNNWRASEGELFVAFEFQFVRLINDFAAQALAAPLLPADTLRRIGPDIQGADFAPLVVMGAGTGFGVAGLARSERGDVEVAGEGGHGAFAPVDETEIEVLRILTGRFGRTSIERILSGPGLFNLYRALAEIQGAPATLADETAVTSAAEGGDALAGETLDRFCAILGSVAGDLALTYGARGGVFISGGLAPRMADRLEAGEFRRRFEAKGRMSGFMAQIPTTLIQHPYAALVGAAGALKRPAAGLR
ncbi:MAG: glucokinase [Phenylobacterium sp.]